MLLARRIVLVCAVLLLSGLWFYSRDDSPKVAPPSAIVADTDSRSTVAALEPAEKQPDPDEPDCLTPAQLESHPVLYAESVRFLPLFANGPDTEAFRGLPRPDVLLLAKQNDTAAMAVLGAMAMMRAQGRSEDGAVDYLNPSENSSWRSTRSENSQADYQEAYDWFYKSAMHGRLFSLTYAGLAQEGIERSLIKRGLITQEEYDSLPRGARGLMNISNVYGAATADIAGNPDEGILGMVTGIMPRSDIMNALAADVAQKFRDDVNDAGLPPIVIPDSRMPTFEEMKAMVCEEFHPPGDTP